MRNIVTRIWRGLHNSERYGPHPGTPYMIVFPLMAFIAGGWKPALFTLVMFLPFYLYGAYERGYDD